ncbi:MAG: flagellar biosynthetic protein FliO [Phenylobacterium sp.]|jgi:flagellar protein FliO/FliZ|uniref:FliO/MopB family protein n=1 Tax=Phenylobacterium sp. TaxID=1871053 RepID=UPI002A316058|nr:flagellar biosynthetic protein FliO [Phenylobacterium sp.]MDD3838930.1 flagellar biosynthetic protein FliO [Phenylobacterium sp.]MDX9999033.1 flagellar biosynthetic protein FliO [Phenylobacterium sp.]
MTFADFAQAVFALALVLGLIGLCAVGLRRFGPDALTRFAPTRKDRRIRVVETLVLDPARRLVIVEVDGAEKLLLLGEGRQIAHGSARDLADA